MRQRAAWLVPVVLAGVMVSACGRGADSGATSNPNAPGSPGTGNAPVSATPQQPDSRAGGSTGPMGAPPAPESSGADAPVGTTGRGIMTPGTAAPGPASGSTAAESSASMPSAAPQGSANQTTGSRY